MANTLSISDQWPDKGSVQFTDFRLRYGVDLPWVLNGLTFNIRALEKIGVVGRTGAGLPLTFSVITVVVRVMRNLPVSAVIIALWNSPPLAV